MKRLHGLVRAVEKEAGKLSRVVASVTSLMVLEVMRCSGGPLSSSRGPVVIDGPLPNQ